MLLRNEDIYLNEKFLNKTEAIHWIGQKMLEKGFIQEPYIDSMIRRDATVSVAIGNYLAIPHSEQEGFCYILQDGMVFVQLVEPLNWDGEEVWFLIGLALGGDQQLEGLQSIAIAFSDPGAVEKFYQELKTPTDVLTFLNDN